jgi:hypothetical protein
MYRYLPPDAPQPLPTDKPRAPAGKRLDSKRGRAAMALGMLSVPTVTFLFVTMLYFIMIAH